MNEYTQVRNAHDRAVILAQLVNADARVFASAILSGHQDIDDDEKRYEQSRAELWKLIGPAPEGEPVEAEEPKRKLQPWDPR